MSLNTIVNIEAQLALKKADTYKDYLQKTSDHSLCKNMTCLDAAIAAGIDRKKFSCGKCVGVIRLEPLRLVEPNLNWNNINKTINTARLLNINITFID